MQPSERHPLTLIRGLLKLMRPKHYIKNFIIFLPLVFGSRLLDIGALVNTAWVFVVFSLVASAVYIVNDILDRERDRSHPTKCKRPIAAGIVPVPFAWILFFFLVLLAGILLATAVRNPVGVTVVLAGYLAINMAYSGGLKGVPVVDIVILVAGYYLRVVAGSLGADIPISNWMYLTVLSASFFLGLGKRRNELERVPQENQRPVLKHYNVGFLTNNMYVFSALTVVFYSLWCVSFGESDNRNSQIIIWTIPLVMVFLLRYSLIVEAQSEGDPVEVILRDQALVITSLLLAAVFLFALYV